jgi:hypothetical protein
MHTVRKPNEKIWEKYAYLQAEKAGPGQVLCSSPQKEPTCQLDFGFLNSTIWIQ